MLSTQSSAQMTTVRVRWNQQTVEKPVVVNEYNHSMNEVDTADQNSVYYRFIRKTRKWWRKFFFLATKSDSSEQLCSLPSAWHTFNSDGSSLSRWPHVTSRQLLLILFQAVHENGCIPQQDRIQSVLMDSSTCLGRENLCRNVSSAVTAARRDTAATTSARLAPLLRPCAQQFASRSTCQNY